MAFTANQESSPEDDLIIEARRALAETETQPARYRAACGADSAPALVAGWIPETHARRARGEQVLQSPDPSGG